MLPWSGYQDNLSSSFVVGQQLGDVPPRGLQMPVHRDGQPAVLTAAPHPRAQDGVLGVGRGVEEEKGTCQETGRVTLQCVWGRACISSAAGFKSVMLEAFFTFLAHAQPSCPSLRFVFKK